MLACMIALIAVISAVAYMLVPFRPNHLKAPAAPQSRNSSLVVPGTSGSSASGANG